MYARNWARSVCAAASLLAAISGADRAAAQSSSKAEPLPAVTVIQKETAVPARPAKKTTAGKTKQKAPAPLAPPPVVSSAQTGGANAMPSGVPASRVGSL